MQVKLRIIQVNGIYFNLRIFSVILNSARNINLTIFHCRYGVRIKTPTVKGILDLDKLNEERSSDSESARLAFEWKLNLYSPFFAI